MGQAVGWRRPAGLLAPKAAAPVSHLRHDELVRGHPATDEAYVEDEQLQHSEPRAQGEQAARAVEDGVRKDRYLAVDLVQLRRRPLVQQRLYASLREVWVDEVDQGCTRNRSRRASTCRPDAIWSERRANTEHSSQRK